MDLRQSIRKQNDVVLSLSKHVIATVAKGSNLVFSPASINLVLSMIAAGSDGATRDQLLSFLGASSTDHLNALSSEIVSVIFADGSAGGGPRLSAANGVWIDKSLSFKPSFKQLLESSYKAASNQVDFQTKAAEVAAEVNSWAEKQTNGLIKGLLPPGSIDSMTRLIFANAVYFKGAWDKQFNASLTKDDDFHLLNGTSVRVPFMTSKTNQCISAYDGFKVLELPYRAGEERDTRYFSMYFYLPDAKDGLPALVEKMGSSSGFLDSHKPRGQVMVGEFKIPRFKISFGFEASQALKGMGQTLLFGGEEGVTELLDPPSTGENSYVSCIIHRAFIGVNEEGTEAAAASAVIRMGACRVTKKLDFVADHPFLFLIRENTTGAVLFIGQVLDPSQD